MKNTLKNKAKFFAQYWGQEVTLYTEFPNTSRFFGKVDYEILRSTLEGDKINFHLELKPLSIISDEDAFYYAKNFLNWSNPEHYKDHFILHNCEIKGFIHADFLRSKGYALPWMDLSIENQIEYGWAKLKPE